MREPLVYLSKHHVPDSEPALAEPVFVIEHHGKLYITRALWEYDEGEKDPEVARGVHAVRELFERHVGDAPARTAGIPLTSTQVEAFDVSKPPNAND